MTKNINENEIIKNLQDIQDIINEKTDLINENIDIINKKTELIQSNEYQILIKEKELQNYKNKSDLMFISSSNNYCFLITWFIIFFFIYGQIMSAIIKN